MTYDASPEAGAAANCVPNVRRTFQVVFGLASGGAEGLQQLRRAFQLCSPLSSPRDALDLAYWIQAPSLPPRYYSIVTGVFETRYVFQNIEKTPFLSGQLRLFHQGATFEGYTWEDRWRRREVPEGAPRFLKYPKGPTRSIQTTAKIIQNVLEPVYIPCLEPMQALL